MSLIGIPGLGKLTGWETVGLIIQCILLILGLHYHLMTTPIRIEIEDYVMKFYSKMRRKPVHSIHLENIVKVKRYRFVSRTKELLMIETTSGKISISFPFTRNLIEYIYQENPNIILEGLN